MGVDIPKSEKKKSILIIAAVIVTVIVVLLTAIVVVMHGFGTYDSNANKVYDKNENKVNDSNENKVTGLLSYTDISYGTYSAQKFDIYVPKNANTPLPLIIFVHGGAWIAGDKGDVSAIAKFLANQGFVVINMNYRLLPTFSYPAPLEDFQMVLRWVKQNSEQYRIDTAHIGMSGHSAGGHLVALYALTQNEDYITNGSTLPRVYAIAPMAGGYTLEGINITSPRRENTIIAWLKTADPQSMGLPIYRIDSDDNVSFLLLHGDQDTNSPPAQSTMFYDALVAEGVPAELKIYPGRDHLTLVSGIPNNDEVARDLVSFFNQNLK
jgi:acetyl esterase/lipase